MFLSKKKKIYIFFFVLTRKLEDGDSHRQFLYNLLLHIIRISPQLPMFACDKNGGDRKLFTNGAHSVAAQIWAA